jgi:acyl-CoA thioester hydrolase
MTPPGRRQKSYFPLDPAAPRPLVVRVHHQVRFSDVDPMAFMWHGRYANLFEQANEALGRLCGMSYPDFHREKLAAPIVQFHVDYFAPLTLGEKAEIVGKMIWNDAARIDIEYEIYNQSGQLAATGYTVQMFIDETSAPLMVSPPMLETCRTRWRAGEFDGMR